MSTGKFITAQMQRATVQTQKLKQQQYKSTYKYFQNKNMNTQIADVFQKKEEVEKPKNKIIEILTGKNNK